MKYVIKYILLLNVKVTSRTRGWTCSITFILKRCTWLNVLIRPILEGYKWNDKVLERCLEKYGKEKVEILGNSSTDHPRPGNCCAFEKCEHGRGGGGVEGAYGPPPLFWNVKCIYLFVNEEKNLFKNFNFENLQLLRLWFSLRNLTINFMRVQKYDMKTEVK